MYEGWKGVVKYLQDSRSARYASALMDTLPPLVLLNIYPCSIVASLANTANFAMYIDVHHGIAGRQINAGNIF